MTISVADLETKYAVWFLGTKNAKQAKLEILALFAKNATGAPFARRNRATVPEVRAGPYSGKNSMLKYSRHTGV